MSRHDPRKVFVGNVPYEVSEEEVRCILSEVGELIQFRLRTDPANTDPTRLHRGFGFADFTTAQAAERAKRELNGRLISGRPIKVADPAEPGAVTSALPNSLSSTHASATAIAKALESLSLFEKWTILKEFQALIQQDPERAKQLMRDVPPLTQALLHCQAALGIVNTPVAEHSGPLHAMARPEVPLGAPRGPAQMERPMHPRPAGSMPPPGMARGPPRPYDPHNMPHPSGPMEARGAPGPMGVPPRHYMEGARPMRPSQGAQLPRPRTNRAAEIHEIMRMSEADVDALQPERQRSVRRVRMALGKPVQYLRSLPPHEGQDLLKLRASLEQLLHQ